MIQNLRLQFGIVYDTRVDYTAKHISEQFLRRIVGVAKMTVVNSLKGFRAEGGGRRVFHVRRFLK